MLRPSIKILTTLAAILLAPTAALAYVGPGAGVSLLGSLWGLILAVVFVVFGLLIFPIKIVLNTRKKRLEEDSEVAEEAQQAESAAAEGAEKD